MKCETFCWIQIILVLVFIFSRYWSKSIIRAPLSELRSLFGLSFNFPPPNVTSAPNLLVTSQTSSHTRLRTAH